MREVWHEYGPRVRQWWSEPVDYTAQVAYFAKRSMSQAIKVAIGLGNGMNGAMPLALLLPAVAPGKPAARIAMVAFALLMFFWAWRWCLRPWPSRRMSIGFIVSCDIGIAMVALQDPNWLTGFWGFNAFAQISVYLLFFDGPKGFAVPGRGFWSRLRRSPCGSVPMEASARRSWSLGCSP